MPLIGAIGEVGWRWAWLVFPLVSRSEWRAWHGRAPAGDAARRERATA